MACLKLVNLPLRMGAKGKIMKTTYPDSNVPSIYTGKKQSLLPDKYLDFTVFQPVCNLPTLVFFKDYEGIKLFHNNIKIIIKDIKVEAILSPEDFNCPLFLDPYYPALVYIGKKPSKNEIKLLFEKKKKTI